MPETIRFVGSGGHELAAVVRRPEGAARGSVLMAHCFTCSKDLHTMTRLADALAAAGWVSFAFDFTGLGESGGDFAGTTVSTNVGDLRRAALTMLAQRIGPCLLLGHSLGGAAAVLAAASLKTVDRVICVASPSDVGHIRALLPSDADERDDRFTITVGGRPFALDPGFLDDLDDHSVLDAAAGLGRPMLVVEAGADAIVDRSQTRALAAAGGADIAVVEGADHLFSGIDHARQLADIVVEWASRDTSR
ncbi:MAG: alpha/beta hydrolase [Acidimicrobiales bacterium]|nr:alpha/beta hydrolase [Acidimicrobiales bacterium]